MPCCGVRTGVKEESRQRPSDSPDATLGEGTEGMGSSPSFGSKEHKHQRLVPISESKTADSDPEPVWARSIYMYICICICIVYIHILYMYDLNIYMYIYFYLHIYIDIYIHTYTRFLSTHSTVFVSTGCPAY